jgi:predicted secreted protein
VIWTVATGDACMDSEVIDPGRRAFVRAFPVLAIAGCGFSGRLLADEIALPTVTPDGVTSALTAIDARARRSDRVRLTLPDRIEDGSSVPVTVTAELDDVTEIYILADMNPMPIAAQFRLGAGIAPRISVRIRLAASGQVYGAVHGRDGLHWTARSAEVIAGGCT